jgi:tetratricopeptide (TPR) repeat protein
MLRQQVLAVFFACFLLGVIPAPGWGSQEDLKEALALNEQVGQLYRAGRFKQALPLAHKALQIRYKDLGPEHPEIAISLTTLGMLYQEMGSPDEALPLLERALQIRYKALGPSNLDTAASLNNLGELYRIMGAHEKALPLLERALRTRERVLGPEHPDTASSLNNLAALYQDKGEYDRALPLYERALKIRERALSSNHPDTAASLNNLAELYRIRGTYEKSLPLHEKALRINEKVLGPEHPGIALNLNNLATLYHDMGFYVKAQPLYERALQIREKALGPEHLSTAQSLNNLGVLYYSLKEYDKALPLYERALQIREKSLNPEHPDVAVSLNNLGSLYKGKGDFAKALPLYERALMIREKALGPEHPDTAASLNTMGALHKDMGDPAKAAPLYERVVKIHEKISGPEHPDTVDSLNNLALAYQGMGEYDKALPLYTRALKIREKALGAEHLDTLASINNLAALYYDMGAYEKALPLYKQVLKIREKTPGPDQPDTAISLNNLALVYQGMGEYDTALPLYERSLKIKETALDPEHPSTARTLTNLASLYQAMGAYDKALPLYDRAAKIREKAVGPDHPDTAGSLDNLAALYVAMGMYDKALPLYDRVWKIREKSQGPTHLDTATSLKNLASLYQTMGDCDKAMPLYDRAGKIFEKALGPEHPDTAKVLVKAGTCFLAKKDPEKAAEYFNRVKSKEAQVDLALARVRPDEALQLLEGMSPRLVSTPAYQVHLNTQKGLALAGVGRLQESAVTLWQAVQGVEKKPRRTPGYRADFLRGEENIRPYRSLVEVLAQISFTGADLPPELQEFGPGPQAAAFALAEATKARVMLEALAQAPRNTSRAELPPDLRQREEALNFRLAAHEAQWEKAVQGGKEALKEVINNRKKLNTEFETLISELQQTQPLFAALYYPKPLPGKDLPLADNEVLIEYAVGEGAGAIFVVRKDGVQYMHPLPLGREALEAQVREFMEPLVNSKVGGFPVKKGEELYDLLLARPLATVKPGEQVIIVPDGILGLLPFEALVSAAGSNPETSIFVGDQRTLLYYPSAAVLVQQRGREEPQTPRPLLALGNPIYNAEDERYQVNKKKKAGKAAAPVPVPAEGPPGYQALATNATWGPTTRGATGKERQIYPPLPESEKEVRELAQLFEVKPEPPDILLNLQAGETQLRQAPLQDYQYLHFATHADLTDKVQGRLEPFILLGQVDNKAPDDGFLTLSEVIDLKLAAQMVVLSHGRTGRGQVMEGEGVVNLARAFQYAGARSVLISLWEVKSTVALEFLKKFYGYLKEGKTRGEALRLARFDIKMLYPDPFFWAGFILHGEG